MQKPPDEIWADNYRFGGWFDSPSEAPAGRKLTKYIRADLVEEREIIIDRSGFVYTISGRR